MNTTTRWIALAVIGLTIGVVGASVVVISSVLAPPEEIAEEIDGEADDEELADEVAEVVREPEPQVPVPTTQEVASGLGEGDLISTDGVAGPGADTIASGSERLARIFGAMRPAEAAKVLEKLSDTEIRAIIRHIPDRKAAAILGNFDATRAAELSRNVIFQGAI